MRLYASGLAAFGALAVSCGINPQPEPPGGQTVGIAGEGGSAPDGGAGTDAQGVPTGGNGGSAGSGGWNGTGGAGAREDGGMGGGAGAAGGPPSACTRIAYLDFENNLVDPFGLADTQTADTFVSYAPGVTGLAARSSHNDDDGGDDFTVLLGTVFENQNELTIRFWVNYEQGYENCDPNEIYNIKLFWTLGSDAHNEIIIQELGDDTASLAWQLNGGGTGWEAGTRVTEWASAPYRRGDWMQVEIYFRLSSGTAHLEPDGIQRLRIDGQTIIEGSDVITGVPGRVSSPAIKATCDATADHGWWLIDEYEVCSDSIAP